SASTRGTSFARLRRSLRHLRNGSGGPIAGRGARRDGFLRRHALSILAWPAAGGIVIALLWAVTLSQLEEDYQEVREAIVRQSQSLSRAYAEQLRRTVDQIDRITLDLKYSWENPDVSFDLSRQSALGLVADSVGMAAAILDREGRILTSTEEARQVRVEDALLRHHMRDERDA